jgi:hypothetical protein
VIYASSGCAAGIAVLIAVIAALFVVTSWPAYFFGLLHVSQGTADRLQRTIVRGAVALTLAAAAGLLFVIFARC